MSIKNSDSSAQVAILLCTYNGASHLQAQLDSIAKQTHKNWVIYASDDGSTDNTKDILAEFSAIHAENRVELYDGPKKGFARNFYSLLSRKEVVADYYAFCDQDDIWDSDKLETAIEYMSRIDSRKAVLVCGRTRYVNNELKQIGHSPLFKKSPSFKNALVQSIAGGNTMLINNRARYLICKVSEDKEIVSHDWMCYLIVSAVGGVVYYDPVPHIGYRQHGSNLVGANSSFKERVFRLKGLFKGTFKKWNNLNAELLADVVSEMSEENKSTYDNFRRSRSCSYLKNLYYAFRSGVYRQTFLGTAGLIVAYLFRKV